MNNNYGDIDKALNIESNIIEVEKSVERIDIIPSKSDDIRKDYEYTRANLYSLIEKGQEAINGIMELAGEGGSPRAYEVAGQLIKSVADTTDKLMDLQKKLKVGFNEVTEDGQFSLKEGECMGCCGGAPLMHVNNTHMHEFLTPAKVDEILGDLK